VSRPQLSSSGFSCASHCFLCSPALILAAGAKIGATGFEPATSSDGTLSDVHPTAQLICRGG
jgi:hypothetical protein